jgi:hypothetical protein
VMLGKSLQIKRYAVVGHLLAFWSWCDAHLVVADDSNTSQPFKYTHAAIDEIAGVSGFAESMIEVGWLVQTAPNTYLIPNADRHLSKTAKKRAMERNKKAEQRKCPAPSRTKTGHDTQQSVPQLSQICPDRIGTETGLEKRREEKRVNLTSFDLQTERASPPFVTESNDSRLTHPLGKPPELMDIEAYCRSAGYQIDCNEFLDHYRANGWVQSNGQPIRDWRAALRNWVKRAATFAAKPSTQRGRGGGYNPNAKNDDMARKVLEAMQMGMAREAAERNGHHEYPAIEEGA